MDQESGGSQKLPHESRTIQAMVMLAAATPVIWPLLPPACQDPKYSNAAICLVAIVFRLVTNEKIVWYGSNNEKP
jgi:hypothetical protein